MGKRWDDIFYFSKSDRRALLLLLGFLAGVVVTSVVFFSWEQEHPSEEGENVDSAYRAFFDGLVRDTADTPVREPYRQEAVAVSETFCFDPNTADSTALLRLGLKPWQVRNIYKYRARGGRYHRPEDFARLYGLTKGDYDRLYPYICIADEYKLLADVSPEQWQDKRSVEKESTSYPEKYEEGTRIELNAADTVMLKKIPGIGSYYARKIVDYRKRLGGFVSVLQLEEVEGLPEDVERWFTITSDVVSPLCINRLPVDKMRRHPYINFHQGRVIAAHRRKYGAIKKLQELSLYEEFTPADLERLQPYVSFEE